MIYSVARPKIVGWLTRSQTRHVRVLSDGLRHQDGRRHLFAVYFVGTRTNAPRAIFRAKRLVHAGSSDSARIRENTTTRSSAIKTRSRGKTLESVVQGCRRSLARTGSLAYNWPIPLRLYMSTALDDERLRVTLAGQRWPLC